MPEPLLQIDNLSIVFRQGGLALEAVSQLTFEIATGDVVAMVGESGSGKSVSALAVTGLLPEGVEIRGDIRFAGRALRDLSAADERALRGGRIAYIFQEPATALNPVFTAGYQIDESLRLHGRTRDRRRRVLDLLADVGIREPERVARAYPHQLSGGQQQRVMIAMALAGEPQLLIADEPTTALDVTVQAQILDLLARIQRERGMAVWLITHNLAIAAKLAQRVVVMYAGQVVETGPVADVLASPRHPYTRALLQAVPRLRDPDRALLGIPGNIPPLHAMPSGCRFHPRCAMVRDRCSTEGPPLATIDAARASRCWFHAEVSP